MADSSSQLNRTPNPPLPSRPSQTKMSPQDYLFLRILGEGSFSTVYLTENIHSHDKYAIKVMYKAKILREKKSQYVKRERDALARCNHPFIVQLFCTFQDEEKLYFALTYCKYGELLNFLKKNGSFDLPCSKFYSAEMVCAIEYLHSKDIIHRDLKPENILLDTGMHIRITDFGSARILDEPAPTSPPQPSSDSDTPPMRSRTRSFVGTAQYVSPEMLQGRANHKSSDLWALGCIVFQMISGLMPFWGSTEYAIFQKILKLDYEIPTGFEPVAKDLIQRLLVLDPTQRLGCEECGGFATLKSHPFYSGIDWDHLPTSTPPKLMPYLPATDDSPELHSFYEVPENIEPGLDDKQMTRLLGLEVCDFSHVRERKESLSTKLPYLQKKRLLDEQAQQCQFHKFVSGNLILKQGLVEKRKGLFSRKRMLLLTEGPHLYYVDPNAMVLKGEIPWSKELRPEPKNFKVFFVHTPKRTYYLEDPEGFALEWCKKIEEVRLDFFGSDTKP